MPAKRKSSARRAVRAKQSAAPKPRRQCGTMIAYNRLVERDPGFRARLVALETATQRLAMAVQPAPKLRTIKVVVHVVYRTAAENVSSAQIKSQLKVLNRDFAATNPDKSKVPAVWAGLLGDAKIRFRLAPRGIRRVQTSETSFGTDDFVKQVAPPADARKYLNLWVCTLAGGLLGYAQFPGGPAATDGVVVLNTAFGTTGTARAPFNSGRTATHEVGHYLNLHHIWGDGGLMCDDSDYVDDTPNQEGPNYNKPTFPSVSCKNGPNGDMFMNYMDYVDDDSMVMFTAQQVARMRATLAGPRGGL
jgi:hypothetical protein